METDILNGHDLKMMFDSALARFADKYKFVDSLNVFPVPDGDTGTNMYLTLTAAVEGIASAAEPASIGCVAEAASQGALMGARGNSGVILSQLLRGMAQGLNGMERVSGNVFASSLEEGVTIAYKAIMKPVEGTILTVAREASKEAVRVTKKHKDLHLILEAVCSRAQEVLDQTPDMLPALKEAGVVDAGGMGWLLILQGFVQALSGTDAARPAIYEKPADKPQKPEKKTGKQKQPKSELLFPYCTEVLIRSGAKDGSRLEKELTVIGDSLILAVSGGITKVHIHTNHPGKVLEACLNYGPLVDIKIYNMNEQVDMNVPQDLADPVLPEQTERVPMGIVSVAFGEGIKNIMASLGADKVVLGGQTMNPSAQELLLAVKSVNAREIIILPNNNNIILTANQVSDLTDQKIHVIPTKTIPQGIAALLATVPGDDLAKVVKDMTAAAGKVKTGEVTYAVRDTVTDGRKITRDSIIGIFEDRIVCNAGTVFPVVTELLGQMISEEDEICTIYYGEAITPGDADSLLAKLEPAYPNMEFEIHSGGQPLYYYVIGVE